MDKVIVSDDVRRRLTCGPVERWIELGLLPVVVAGLIVAAAVTGW
jgi:hypothetical protein